MKRLIMLLTVVAVMAAFLAASAFSASATTLRDGSSDNYVHYYIWQGVME